MESMAGFWITVFHGGVPKGNFLATLARASTSPSESVLKTNCSRRSRRLHDPIRRGTQGRSLPGRSQISDLDSTVDSVWDPIRNDSGFQQVLTGKAALKYRDKLDHWCAHDSTGRTNSEHRDGFLDAGPPLTTDWDFVLDF